MDETINFRSHEVRTGSEAGARDDFEKMLVALVKATIDPAALSAAENPGDWGMDVIVGSLDGELSVWQAKYFPAKVTTRQHDQIRGSLETVASRVSAAGGRVTQWTLAVPSRLDPRELLEWEKLVAQWQKKGVTLHLWDGDELRALLARPEAHSVKRTFYGWGRADLGLELERLKIRNEMGQQSVFARAKNSTTEIRWTMVLVVEHVGQSVLAIDSIEPDFGWRLANGEIHTALAVSGMSNHFYRYESVAEYIHINQEPDARTKSNAHFGKRQDWPMIIRPGDRFMATVRVALEFRVDGTAGTLLTDQIMADALGYYFELEPRTKGVWRTAAIRIPMRLTTAEAQRTVSVACLIAPIGAQVLRPTPEQIRDILDSDPL